LDESKLNTVFNYSHLDLDVRVSLHPAPDKQEKVNLNETFTKYVFYKDKNFLIKLNTKRNTIVNNS